MNSRTPGPEPTGARNLTDPEIWRRAELPHVVEVRGTASTSAEAWVDSDRTYRAGTTYLFVLDIADGMLRDSTCTATSEWNAGLEVLNRHRRTHQ